MYDCIVVGGGPGGLTAGFYAKWLGLKTLIITDPSKPSSLELATLIENYPGYESISGKGLLDKMRSQAEKQEVEIKEETVTSLKLKKDSKVVYTNKGEYEAKTVIISTGAEHKKGGIPGEKEFIGRGVSYCATCDGVFFKGKDVIVWGGGNTALSYATYLQNIGCKVTLVHRRKDFKASEHNVNKAKEVGVKFILERTLKEIKGNKLVSSVILDDDKEIKASAVFVAIGEVPSVEIIKNAGIKVDNANFIIVDDKRTQETNVKGVYAVGDVTNTPMRQVIVSCGEAAIAALSAYKKVKGIKEG